MALINCEECGQQISDKAVACPHCGCPVMQKKEESHTLNPDIESIEREIKQKNDVFLEEQREDISSWSNPESGKEKFYKKTWFIILILIIFFPVGVFLMWKTKKIHAILRVVLSAILGLWFAFWLLVFIVFVMPCSHEWTEATCTSPKTCWICGETEGSALGHYWEDATYETAKTCTICGLTDGEPLERNEAYGYTQAKNVIEECLDFVPDCELSLSFNEESGGMSSYAIKNDGELVGILGINADEWDAVSLIDPDKLNSEKYHEQIAIAILLSSDNDMTYSEAKEYFEESQEEGLIFIGSSYVSEGIQNGMYAFGVNY